MLIKQISVFLENRVGRLASVTEALKAADIDIRALSLADAREFGILRLIVNDPEKAIKVLKEDGYTVKTTEVIAAGVHDIPGGVGLPVKLLSDNSINIDYMYAFLSKLEDTAFVILRVNDNNAAVELLKKNDIKILSSDEIYNM